MDAELHSYDGTFIDQFVEFVRTFNSLIKKAQEKGYKVEIKINEPGVSLELSVRLWRDFINIRNIERRQ